MNYELRLKKYSGKSGFTLAEILVVMAITAIVGTILMAIFTNTLRGSNKSQILAVIKQNGQAVLENMDKTIRNADNIVCVTPSGNTLVLVKNGIYTRFRFTAPSSGNGLIQQENPVQPSPTAAKSDIRVFKDSLCTNDTDPLIGAVTLTDDNPQSGVSVECPALDCSINPPPIFASDKPAGFRDQVTIKFNLKPGVGASAAITSQIDPVTFQTTIGLR